jgi:hypothetical protein
MKKVRVGRELVFYKEIIGKGKGNCCKIYFHREAKSSFVP